jgi:hypothetical protein
MEQKRVLVLIFLLAFVIFPFSSAQPVICPSGTQTLDLGSICLKESDGSSPYVIQESDFCDNPTCAGNPVQQCGADGFYHVDNTLPPLIISTPNLVQGGIYALNLSIRRGSTTPVPQTEENFTIQCNGVLYDFPDDGVDNPDLNFTAVNVNCDFVPGVNSITITGTGEDSVHIEQYHIAACIPFTLDAQINFTELPFFTPLSFLLSFFLIAFIYIIMIAKTSKQNLNHPASIKTNL